MIAARARGDRRPSLHHRRHRRPEEGDPGNASRAYGRADRSGSSHRLRLDPVRGRRGRLAHPHRPAFRCVRCVALASRSSSSPTRPKAPRGSAGVYEAFGPGLCEPIAFSAEHGEGLSELYDALVEVNPASGRLDPDEQDEAEPLVLGAEARRQRADLAKALRIVLRRRLNAGKSTLNNRIFGKDRLLAGPEPGITRDLIGLDAEGNGARSRSSTLRACVGSRGSSRRWRSSPSPTCAARGALRRSREASVRRHHTFERQDPTLEDLRREGGQGVLRHRPQQKATRRQQERQGPRIARGS